MGRDLWPKDIGADTDIVPPVVILKEKAVSIGQKTGGLIEGRVSTRSQGNMIHHQFSLVAPTQGGIHLISVH